MRQIGRGDEVIKVWGGGESIKMVDSRCLDPRYTRYLTR